MSLVKNNQNEKNQDTFKLSDFKSKQKCTYFQFGEIPIFQEANWCEICDPNKTEMICQECFQNCHKTCQNDE